MSGVRDLTRSLRALVEGTEGNAADFLGRVWQVATKRGFVGTELGQVNEIPIWLFRLKSVREEVPNLLVAAGFHGEERGGPWGLLKFLEQAPDVLLRQVNLSFLPLVNPTGFDIDHRYNLWGEDPAWGFCHEGKGKKLSAEGRILWEHMDLLRELSSHGFLTLHEDPDDDHFYVYSFEASEKPGPLSELLRDVGGQFFPVEDPGFHRDHYVDRGIVYRRCDGSLEDCLYHDGVPHTMCTETPMVDTPLERRAECNARLVQAMIEFLTDEFA